MRHDRSFTTGVARPNDGNGVVAYRLQGSSPHPPSTSNGYPADTCNDGPDLPLPPPDKIALTRLAENGADAAQIADAIVSAWEDIEVVLTPILGSRGLAMLYKRSVHLTVPHHPWLAAANKDPQAPMDLSLLKSVLTQRASADTAAVGAALLQTFDELLISLIGHSLAEQLLRSIWARTADGPPAQDTAP